MSASGPSVAAIQYALQDLERALARDRSHVLVTGAPRGERSLLLREAPRHLPASVRAVPVSLVGAEEDEVCARILRGLGCWQPGGDAEAQLFACVHALAARGSALALLVDDAALLSLPALARLGRLAAAARPQLRLVLFVGDASAAESDVTSRVVRALGLGVQKIACDGGAVGTAPRVAHAPQPGSSAPAVPVERGGFRAGWLPAAAASLGGGLLLLVLLASPNRVAEREAAARPPASQPMRRVVSTVPLGETPIVAAPPPAPALPAPEEAEAPLPPAEEVAREPDDTLVVPPGPAPVESEPRAAAASPPRTVAVNLNARPWARIEVDGREIGITPLAGLRLSQGPHRFRAHFGDGRVVERTLTVGPHRNRVTFP